MNDEKNVSLMTTLLEKNNDYKLKEANVYKFVTMMSRFTKLNKTVVNRIHQIIVAKAEEGKCTCRLEYDDLEGCDIDILCEYLCYLGFRVTGESELLVSWSNIWEVIKYDFK